MEPTTTDKLLEVLKSADSLDAFLKDAEGKQIEFTQSEYFDFLFEQKGISKAEVIKRSLMDAFYCYQIFRGEKVPSREKVLLLAFAFPLDVAETQMLLYTCNSSKLYIKNKRDSILLFGLENNLPLDTANDLLSDEGEAPLV